MFNGRDSAQVTHRMPSVGRAEDERVDVKSLMAVAMPADGELPKIKSSLPSNEGWVYGTSKSLTRRAKHFVQLRHGVLYFYRDPEKGADWSLVLRDAMVGRGQGRHSVQVSVSTKSHTFFCKNAEEQKKWLKVLFCNASWKLHDFYELGSIVGNVRTSKVQTCTHIATGTELAVKTVTKANRPPDLVYNEMAIISQPLHVNIIHAVDILESADNMYLIQEYMQGGSLYDFIKASGTFTEKQSRQAMRAILEGIKALHDVGIVHRDIKPENILCKRQAWPLRLKIADFGLAGFLQNNGALKSTKHFIGTIGYAAPEQYGGRNCGRAIDMWACGALLFNMLSATMPFSGLKRKEIIKKTKVADYSFTSEWDNVSSEAKAFIRSCFQVRVEKRLTVEQALCHDWMGADD